MSVQAHARPHQSAQRPADLGQRARFDEAVRTAAALALGFALLLVTYWWVADRGVQDLSSWASGLTSVGRISGLVASVLLLAQVLLMARVPVLERAYGQDRLARIHRLVGFTSFNLIVLHIITITWGYAAGKFAQTVSMLWGLTVNYAGMLLAVAGTACLVMVVVTSVKVARRRLRYESWHLLHLYGYLGAGLALPHQLWTGQQFTTSTARTTFWWGLWGVTATAVFVWRVGRPVILNLRHRLRVYSVIDEGDGLWSVHVTGHRLDRLGVEAGQFFTWRFGNGPGWTRANPYSLSAAPDGRSLRITVQGVGDGSRAARLLRPGAFALVEGPHGRLSARTRTRRKVAMIGAGVGVTPLRALAEGLEYEPGGATYVERFSHDPLFAREIDSFERERGLHVVRLPGPRRAADSWLCAGIGPASDLAALLYWIPDVSRRDVYVCGPERWTDLVRRTLFDAGLPPHQLHLETFSW